MTGLLALALLFATGIDLSDDAAPGPQLQGPAAIQVAPVGEQLTTTAETRPTTTAVIRPTIEETFKPPRLLGVRPRQLSLSASGRHVIYRWSPNDAEELKLDWWIAPTDGSSEPRLLFPAEPRVELTWSPRSDELLLFRNGWIERMDLGEEAGSKAQPLFECGDNVSRLQFTRDGSKALLVAGEDAELWVVDLASGARWSPAGGLARRGRWFQLLEEIGQIALFAGPAEARAKAAIEPKPGEVPAPPGPPTHDGDGPKKGTDEPKRVLWFVPLEAEGEPRATTFEEGDRVQLSADGRFIARSRVDSDVKRSLVLADFLTENVSTVAVRNSLAGDPAAKYTLSIFDVEKGTTFSPPLDEGNRFYLLDAEWSPSGARLLVHRLSGDFHVRQLLVFSPDEKRSWPLFSERDDAWIGGPMTLAQWRQEGSEVLFTSEQSGWCHLYTVAAEGGPPRALTAGPFEVQEFHELENGRRAVLVANDPDPAAKCLFLLDLDTGTRTRLSAPDACTEEVLVSRDGAVTAWMQESLGVPGEVFAAPLDEGAQAVQLSHCVTSGLAELALPPPEIVSYVSTDGAKVSALLYRPEPFDPRRKYPAVVFVHGAGYLQNVTRSMTEYPVNMLFHHRLARQGFTVLDADYRHSAGYGRDWRTAIYGFMGGKDLDDECAGVDYLGSLGFVDTTRVGLYGGSYGGFITLMALFTRPEVFACGAALRSVTDWRTYNAWYTNARLGDPKKDAENYKRSSPIDHAEGLTKPLLLLHGLKDSNVFAQDSIRLMEKLIQGGKDFDVMLYPSQDHGFTDPESWIDEYKRIERLFLRELRATGVNGTSAPGTTTTAPRPL